MNHYYSNIEKQTLKNTFYRKVLFTTKTMQLVLMSIPPGQDIGFERHKKTTQFIRIESGKGRVVINNTSHRLSDGYAVIIPPKKKHNIINTGRKPLKLYTIYSPPEHPKNKKEKVKH